ncbi:hypothetical protein CAPTEDRAFT_213481 [Capitella teleta]|uniref:Uncharacterized protein n=1 Tax=Capitella teleta TaxID=283909 RepID=R7TLB3_CAPTE|nr:hypothetical protein CAPTEDRAFT_213481 [Capitella teleta]|eukprot:ELT94464.1 hypothetical protein CAPTEDRAFT_213481 [Capitella teleta]
MHVRATTANGGITSHSPSKLDLVHTLQKITISLTVNAEGSREDRKSKSTDDVNLQEPDSPLSGSPPISRRKKLWRSIKNSTRMLRSKSRERKRRSQTGSEDGIHPDDVDGTEPGLSPTTPTSPYEFETMGLYDQPNENGDSETEGRTNGTLERNSLGRATLGRNATIERMGSEEGDSGIAGDPSVRVRQLNYPRSISNYRRKHFCVVPVVSKEQLSGDADLAFDPGLKPSQGE